MSSNRSIEETAAEYAAGVMHGRVATDFESNMRQNAETRLLLSDWETRIAEFIGVTANELIRSARKHNQEESERAWVAIAPEIFGQALHYDHQIGSMVYMVRMQPGSKCPVAASGSPEECLVVSGDLSLEGVTLTVGDYYSTPKSVIHSGGSSKTGAVLFVRARDE